AVALRASPNTRASSYVPDCNTTSPVGSRYNSADEHQAPSAAAAVSAIEDLSLSSILALK
ncbi:MAG: hypothetical protein IJG47_02875, partial [Microbacterium sp.]|nr:hypothetical protein [Microbacterium sp.]